MQINKHYLIIICFTICLGLIQSQTYSINGTILNFETEKPVINVNIYVENSNIRAVSNKDGFFTLYLNNQLENNIDINIEMIGFETKIIHIDLLKPTINLDNIYLKNQSIDLESVHIHSHQHKTNQISDILLSGQKLNQNRTGNIATTLANQPNIGVNSFGNVTSKPVLRGYSGDRFLLTRDGNEIGDLS